jgi:hypothetical protein
MIPLYVRPLGYLSLDAYYADSAEPTDEELGWNDEEPISPECEENDDAV